MNTLLCASLIVLGLMTFALLGADYYVTRNDENLGLTTYYALDLTYSVITDLGIIIAYVFIYVKLRIHINYLIISRGSDLSSENASILRSYLWHLGLLFVSICQMYAYRLIVSFLYFLHFDESSWDQLTWTFVIFKTIFILGVFSAITYRMSLSSTKIVITNRAPSCPEKDLVSDTLTIFSPDIGRREINHGDSFYQTLGSLDLSQGNQGKFWEKNDEKTLGVYKAV